MHLLDPAPFGRILPAMVTPMKSDGAVDYDAAQTIARQLVADGADGIVVNGTTGESPTTHMDEKVELVRAVKDVVDVPVISGAGSNDTAHTVRMVEQTQEAGADNIAVASQAGQSDVVVVNNGVTATSLPSSGIESNEADRGSTPSNWPASRSRSMMTTARKLEAILLSGIRSASCSIQAPARAMLHWPTRRPMRAVTALPTPGYCPPMARCRLT